LAEDPHGRARGAADQGAGWCNPTVLAAMGRWMRVTSEAERRASNVSSLDR
jgi:hypothetical protein